MSNIALQAFLQAQNSVMPNNNVIFDYVAFSTGDIEYNNVTGVLVLNSPGIYYLNWWLASHTSIGGT